VYWKKHGASAGNASATNSILTNKTARVKDFKWKLASKVMMPPHKVRKYSLEINFFVLKSFKVRIWAVDDVSKKPILLDDDLKPLADCMIEDGDNFIVEIKSNDDKWPMDHDQDSYTDIDRKQQLNHYVPRPQRSADEDDVPVGTVTYSSANRKKC